MFEGVVAGILNRFLGKYVQDLDTENLNIGIFSGTVNLNDLRLKPEALYELDLPIEVRIGTIGQISCQIPWTGLYTQPVIINIQDVLILAGPAISNNFFDGEREKKLIRAAKKKILQDLESESEVLGGPQNFFENLLTSIVNNLQIFIRNVHIRYEDSISSKDGSLACGLCLQSMSIETTNNKWKPCITPHGANTVYQMMKIESLSFYWNPNAVVLDDEETRSITANQFYSWRHYMISGLEKFSMHKEDFEFLLKPVTCKVKVIINRSGEARVPRLLVDAVLQDSAAQVSRKQYLSICSLVDSFNRIAINRKFRHLHPNVPVNRNSKKWWKYIYDAVVEQRIKPYTWQAIKTHREHYHMYKDTYKNTLKSPNDTELKLDLQKCEDNLPIMSVVIAREEAKIELKQEEPEWIVVKESDVDWWRMSTPSPVQEAPASPNIGGRSLDLRVKNEKPKGLWSHLSSPEKQRVCELIGYIEGGTKPEKSKLYIEHKVNLTLANTSLTLLNRNKEVLVMTLTQFLLSLETRPSAKAFKMSARAESIVVEGSSADNDLIPMMTADNVYTGTTTNFLSIDFEKNPQNSEADFGLTCSLEPIEVVYNEHALSEIINFFQTRSMDMQDVADILSEKIHNAGVVSKSLLKYVISRKKIININMDLKGPYVIIPECGSLQKSGNILVLDFGRVIIKSDLQPSNNQLEDATNMELEERLYDRLYADCSAMQILFADSGEEWRNARKQADSDLHIIPKIKVNFVLSNSIKQDYNLLPKHKLNVTISSLKLNLSDRRISQILEFCDNLPLPTSNTVPITEFNTLGLSDKFNFEEDRIMADLTTDQLTKLKRRLVLSYINKSRVHKDTDNENEKTSCVDLAASCTSIDHSDEDELWARTVDLPGFDDNVSPNNYITVLLRFVIGEIVLNLSRSLDSRDKSYIMLRLGKVCVDMALMVYGPALQISLQSIMLSDKLHQGASGEYLELITTDPAEEIVNILYRKVRADCPDFKSHFHNVEQSLVVDLMSVSVLFHHEAWQTLFKYIAYIIDKIKMRDTDRVKKIMKPHTQTLMMWLQGAEVDPPIPPGATKFSYSFRLSQMNVRLSHTDMDLLDIKISGLESDCVYKANDRMILKGFCSSLTVDDLSDMTLYSKMVWVDEDKLFEMKYVRHNPRVCKEAGKNELMQCETIKSDGSLKIYLGKMHIVLLYKILYSLQNFIESFIPPTATDEVIQTTEKGIESQLSNIKSWQTRLNISIELHAPVLLLPQKSTSPNLIVFNLGDLTVENFFKDPNIRTNQDQYKPVIDNLLIKLDSMTLSRAVMTLAGSLEVQEPILEPMNIRFDVKRAITSSGSTLHKDVLLYDIDSSMDMITINLGQRDLSTLLAVWSENLTESRCVGCVNPVLPVNSSETPGNSETSVKKLQAFLAHAEAVRKEVTFRFSLEGIELKIFTDIDEVLSSPVRDCSRGLAKIAAGEASVHLDYYSDQSMEMKANLLTLIIEDIRPDTSIVIKKMFHSHAGAMRADSTYISVSTPPILDFTFNQNHAGDRNIDLRVEKTRLNFSVPFFMNLGRFVLDALPGDKTMEGGVVNHGYVGDAVQTKPVPRTDKPLNMESIYQDTPGLSISIQCRKPEVMFFSDLTKTGGHALLFRTELIIDYSRHQYGENTTVSLSGLQIMSKLQSKLKTTQPYLVLHPCDIEFSRLFKNVEEGVVMTVTVSPIDVHLSETTVRTVTDIVDDISDLTPYDEKDTYNQNNLKLFDNDDLWSPKKIPSYVPPNPEEPYYSIPNPVIKSAESFTMVIPSIRILCEVEAKSRIPVLMIKSMLDVSVHDWSKQMYSKIELNLHASYFNEKVDTWEPLLEHVVCGENIYRPWELIVKVFQGKSYPLSSKFEQETNYTVSDGCKGKIRQISLQKKNDSDSETSGDEEDGAENAMTFIRQRKTDSECNSLNNSSEYYMSKDQSSDSENEDKALEKLNKIFTGDSSDGENSDCDSSGAEPSGMESEALSDRDSPPEAKSKKYTMTDSIEKTQVNLNYAMKAESIDSGLESENVLDKMATYVLIDSRDFLNVTLTPQSMKVLYDLAKNFTQKTIPITDFQTVLALEHDTPISLTNDIGPGAKAELISPDMVLATADYDKDYSCPSSPANSIDGRHLESPGSEHDWETFEGGFHQEIRTPTPQPKFSPHLSFPVDPITDLYRKITDERLVIKTKDFDDLTVVCPQRATNKLHGLQPSRNNTKYYIMLNTDYKYKNRKITLRSPLQIRNETSYAIALFYRKQDVEMLEGFEMGEHVNPFDGTLRFHIVEPDEVYNIPLYIAYHCKLYLQPTFVDKYHVTTDGLWWPDLSTDLNVAHTLCCMPKDDTEQTAFSIRVLTTEGCRANKMSHTIPNYLIRLLSPLTIHNRLPYAVEIKIPQNIRIEAGEKTNVYHLNMTKTHRISVEINYLGLPWSGSFNMSNDLEEKILTMTTDCDTDGGNKQLGLGIKIDRTEGCDLFLHAPYWIINKTGLPLQLKGSHSDIVYECMGSEPLLFNYRRTARKKRVRLRVYQSSWSSAIGLETVGMSGLIICNHRERNRYYRILMTVTLSQLCPQLTKIVTLLPYFLVMNDTKKHLRFMEENERADLWIDLAPSQCVPFWPETNSMKLHCKYRDSTLVSQHFPITTVHSTVLRMDKGSGLCVNVIGGIDMPFTITFLPYKNGDAPVRIDNFCEDLFLKLYQEDAGQVLLLSPNQSSLYTWDDPTKERTLFWSIYNNKGKGFKAVFSRDGYGEVRVGFHVMKQSSLSNTNSVTSKLSSTLKKLTPKSPEPESSSGDESDGSQISKATPKGGKPKKDKIVVYWVSYLENFQRVFMLTQDERIAYLYRQRIDSEKCNYEAFLSLSGVGLSLCMQTNTGIKELSYMSIADSPARWEINVAHKWKPLIPELTMLMEDKFKSDQKKCQLKDYMHLDFEKMQMTKPFFGELRRIYTPGLWLQCRKSENQTYNHLKIHRLQIDNQLHEAIFPSVLYPAPVSSQIVKKIGSRPCVEYISLKRNRPYFNQDVYKYVKVFIQEFYVQLDRGFVNYIFNILNQWTIEEKPSMRLIADMSLVHVPITSYVNRQLSECNRYVIVEHMHLSPLKLQLSLSSKGYIREINTKDGSYQENRPKLFNNDFLEFLFNSWSSFLTDMRGVKLKMAYFEINGRAMSSTQIINEAYLHYYNQLKQQFYVLVLGLDVLGNPYSAISDFTRGLGNFFYEPFMGVGEGSEELASRLADGAALLFGHYAGSSSKSSSLLNQSLGDLVTALSFDDEYKKKKRLGMQIYGDLPESLIKSYNKNIKPSTRIRLPRFCHPYEGVAAYSEYQAVGVKLLSTLGRGHYIDSDVYLSHAAINPKTILLLTLRHIFLIRTSNLENAEWTLKMENIVGIPAINNNKLIFNLKDSNVNYFSNNERSIECDNVEVLKWLQAKVESALVLNMEDAQLPNAI